MQEDYIATVAVDGLASIYVHIRKEDMTTEELAETVDTLIETLLQMKGD